MRDRMSSTSACATSRRIGVDRRDFSTMMKRYFHTIAEVRKTVEEASPVELPQMNRAALWSEHLGGVCVIKPEQHLALDAKRQVRKEER